MYGITSLQHIKQINNKREALDIAVVHLHLLEARSGKQAFATHRRIEELLNLSETRLMLDSGEAQVPHRVRFWIVRLIKHRLCMHKS